MLTTKTGCAGSAASGMSAARYMVERSINLENETRALYYAGERLPEVEMSGMDALGQAIVDGNVPFSEALDDLVCAHMRIFGSPNNVEDLESRIADQLLSAADQAERAEILAAEGAANVKLREDMDPELARRFGIDPSGRLTVQEVAHLLTGLRTDGQAIEGKQIQKPTRSVAEVFGLETNALPVAEAVEHVLAGRRADGEAPRDAKGDDLPEEIVQGARRRFLAAYGVAARQEPTDEQIDHMKAGRTAGGVDVDSYDVMRKLTGTKQPIAFVDMTWSADKSVSVAWALAPTEAERAIIQQTHEEAVGFAMNYAEAQLALVRRGKEGAAGIERGTITWMAFNHFTSRPTAEIARVDEQGNAYTDFQRVPTVRAGDPQLHTHAAALNAVLTPNGHVGSMDLDRLDGLVKELGGIYQARLAVGLRQHGIQTELDPQTGAARIVAVPERVRDLFSKRTQGGTDAAREYAAAQGLEWDSLAPDRQAAILKQGIREARLAKDTGTSDFAEWRQQASDVGYWHRSVLRPNEIKPELSPELRVQRAYEVSLNLIEDALSKRAKLGAQEFREFATRGLVAAGIGDDPGRDIASVMRMYREHGVRQDGQMVPIVFGKDAPVRGKERWSVTTSMHVAEERDVISLAKQFAGDRSQALSPASLERAQQRYLADHPKIDPNSPQWRKQAEVGHALATGGRLGVAIGVAGAGKSTLIGPVVAAAHEEGRHVHGIARGWKQATSLREAGIDQKDIAAIAPFLKRAEAGKVKLDANATVILEEISQVGRGDMLRLLKLQQQHGFTLLGIGDPRQAGSIDPEALKLLTDALGDRVPEILTSIRQRTDRNRDIADRFRTGGQATHEALAMKRQDGTAELVAGGRDATIARVAALWRERVEARGDNPDFRLTISAPTNRDAHVIGIAIREQMREMAQLGEDKFTVQVAMRGERGEKPLPLAEDDRVRVFNRVIVDKAHFASNGDVLTVLDASKRGLSVRNDDGVEALVRWDQLRADRRSPVRLAYGYALTIDTVQGMTSDEHINAMPDGSRSVAGRKAYPAESRARDETWLVVNEAAERRQVAGRLSIGEYKPIRNEDIWRNVGDNLGRESTKATALDLLRRGTELRRGTTAALPAALERAEQRERDGHGRTTFRQKLDLHRAGRQAREIAQRVRERVQEHVRAAIPSQAERDAARDRATAVRTADDAARREQTISRSEGLSL